jgi:hypothetical protein
MKIEEAITTIAELPIPTQVLLPMLKAFKRPYDKIDELVKGGYLVQLRRGLYVAGPAINMLHPELFLIANHLYGPSYVTAASALSYWGLIPEKVSSVTSATVRKNTVFKTELGHFHYAHITPMAYTIGIVQVQLTPRQTVMMACPEKALCDVILQTSGLQLRSVSHAMAFLEEDLRIDRHTLMTMDDTIISQCALAGSKTTSLLVLSKTIQSYAKTMA